MDSTFTTIGRSEIAKVAAASVLGTTIEYYDFLISAAAAAIAWPAVFFPKENLAVGVLAAFVLFGVGLLGRPLGAVIFGHLGDRRGRKTTLTWTLVLMGVGTLLIGLTPGFGQIGVAGGILISIFRVVQGIGIGGEWGGASAWVTEMAAKSKWRSLWSSSVQQGVPFGLIASSGIYLVLSSSLSHDDFIAYGWRIPFYIGASTILIGIVVRYRLLESPIFRSLLERREIERAPSLKVLKAYPGRIARLAAAWAYLNGIFYVSTSFAVSYMIVGLKVSSSFAISTVLYTSIAAIFAILFGAFLGDKIGRKRTLLISTILSAIYPYFYFRILNTGDPAMMIAGQVLWTVTLFGYSVLSAFFTEQFPAKYRYSGAGISYNIATPFSGALAPIIAAAIVASNGFSAGWPWVALMLSIYALIGMVATLTTRDTTKGIITDTGVA